MRVFVYGTLTDPNRVEDRRDSFSFLDPATTSSKNGANDTCTNPSCIRPRGGVRRAIDARLTTASAGRLTLD